VYPLAIDDECLWASISATGLAPHDLPLVYCKAHAMWGMRGALRLRALRRASTRAGLCRLAYESGAHGFDAPRSGAHRAATKRDDRPAGFGGAHAPLLCACAVLCLHWKTAYWPLHGTGLSA